MITDPMIVRCDLIGKASHPPISCNLGKSTDLVDPTLELAVQGLVLKDVSYQNGSSFTEKDKKGKAVSFSKSNQMRLFQKKEKVCSTTNTDTRIGPISIGKKQKRKLN